MNLETNPATFSEEDDTKAAEVEDTPGLVPPEIAAPVAPSPSTEEAAAPGGWALKRSNLDGTDPEQFAAELACKMEVLAQEPKIWFDQNSLFNKGFKEHHLIVLDISTKNLEQHDRKQPQPEIAIIYIDLFHFRFSWAAGPQIGHVVQSIFFYTHAYITSHVSEQPKQNLQATNFYFYYLTFCSLWHISHVRL